MKRRESKIPLLLTLIALGLFVHWAVGYVQQQSKTQTLAQTPVEVAAKEPPLTIEAPVVTAEAVELPKTQETVVAQKKPAPVGDEEAIMPHDGQSKVTGRPVNRKLLGLIEASGKRG